MEGRQNEEERGEGKNKGKIVEGRKYGEWSKKNNNRRETSKREREVKRGR